MRPHLDKIMREPNEQQRWTKLCRLWPTFYTVILGQAEVTLQPLEVQHQCVHPCAQVCPCEQKFDSTFNARRQLLLAFRDCIVYPLAKRGLRTPHTLPSAHGDATSPILRQMLFVLLHNGATVAVANKYQSTLNALVLHCFPSTRAALQHCRTGNRSSNVRTH
jgi:hypothetical protein